jgi:hypothetical protein
MWQGVAMSGGAPAGWYQDPGGSGQQRYWDGQQWTDRTSVVAAISPTGPSVAAQPEKSVALGVVLTVLFGPFAYFYVSVAQAIAAIAITLVVIVISIFFFGIPLIVLWVALILQMIRLVGEYNSELQENRSLSTIAPAPTQVSTGSGTIQPSLCTVHVVGEVLTPGLYRIPNGSRVHDAISAAGGTSPLANLAALNVARVITDGEQIVVP